MTNRVIAIDGPSASGKSTVARRVAAELGFLYADSGSLYRAVTWKALTSGLQPADAQGISSLLATTRFEPYIDSGAILFRLDGAAFGQELRSGRVNEAVSLVSAVPDVRSLVGSWLREMSAFGDLVMEGRDIGSAVFPGAGFKFYLDASPAERARRRHGELAAREDGQSITAVGDSLKRRDTIDSTRKTAPLAVAADACVIDTTAMSIEDVVRAVVRRVKGA